MSEIFLYLVKSGTCLGILLLFFVILLRKETFLKLNRCVLLAIVILAFTLPLMETPIWVGDFEAVKIENIDNNIISETVKTPTIVNNTSATDKESRINLNWTAIGLSIYLIGFLIFLLRFLAQILSILFLILGSEREKKENILFVYPGKILAPFSFFSFLFIDKSAYEPASLEQIIAHEKAHIRQKHSWDILLSELLIIIQWFNPFAWWHRKLVETNLEYLADQSLLQSGTDPKTYQYNLLQIAVPNFPYSLATNYNSSLLKKRIMMMQQKKSSVAQSWKYFLLLPVVLMIWMAFGSSNTQNSDQPFISVITADANKADLRAAQDVYNKMEATLVINELKFSDDSRLSSLNITSLTGRWGKCSSVIEDLKPYGYVYYNRESRGAFKCGSLITKKDFQMIEQAENWDFIFINGQRPTRQTIKKLKADTEKWRTTIKGKLKNTETKTSGTTTYTDLTEEKKIYAAEKIAAAKSTTIYYLNGLETDQTIDDFDYKEIRSIELKHKYRNYYDMDGNLLETLTDTLLVEIISQ